MVGDECERWPGRTLVDGREEEMESGSAEVGR
jgi:hypothetical protein